MYGPNVPPLKSIMEKFELLLKNEKIKSYNRISTLIIIINLALFILFAINVHVSSLRIVSVAGAVILTVILMLPLLKVKNERYRVYKSIALYSAVVAWIAMGYWWIGIICALLSLLYRLSIKPVLIFFGNDKINYSSLSTRTILWNELSNVILKDGILTIDFKSNKLLQAEVDAGADVSEKEFNDFCKRRIELG
jgi:hypothetical protein